MVKIKLLKPISKKEMEEYRSQSGFLPDISIDEDLRNFGNSFLKFRRQKYKRR